jgi:hypothetical protein
MRATEIIRGVLDLIDQVECAQQPATIDPVGGAFAQLFAQMSAEPVEVKSAGMYDNSPDVHVQGIDSVTTAAGLGGLNGAKNPSDIRSDSVSMYPNFQAGGR